MEIIKQGFLNLNGKKVFTIFCMRNEPLFESKYLIECAMDSVKEANNYVIFVIMFQFMQKRYMHHMQAICMF